MKAKEKKVAILVLAAGESKRMGQPKQLLPWKGSTLLGHCISQAEKSLIKDVFVVLGAHYKQIISTLHHHNINVIHHKHWENNIGSSIAKGVEYISSKAQYNGILILLADQPQVDSVYINSIYTLFGSSPSKHIIATIYANTFGVPVLFSHHFFDILISQTPQQGAKSILQTNKKHISSIQPQISIEDIDTPMDYKLLYTKFHSSN